MCGIAGTYRLHKSEFKSENSIHSAISNLKHRGPDDHSNIRLETKGGVLDLGHTRLAIIDLSESGCQPMSAGNGRYTITFNGEIYNYKELREELVLAGYQFNTETDTEVLIHCWDFWGESCLRKLKGMFAFAIFDATNERLWLVKDAFGIKPLYYFMDNDELAFSSEIPALIKMLSKKPDYNMTSCYNYLVFGTYDQSEETFFEGIKKLQPGSMMSVDLSKDDIECNQWRWWNPSIEEDKNISFKQAVDRVREQFLENIHLHLRSDVPLGAALSGGIDSSSVVCSMRKLYPDMPIHTFSYIAKGSDVDEENWVDKVNKYVGAIPHKIEFTSDDLILDLDDLIETQGEPFSSTSIYAQYRVFKKVREEGITVSLDGQGADELLAGYNGYPISRFKSLVERKEFKRLLQLMKSWKRNHQASTPKVIKYLRSALVSDNLRDLADRMGRKPSAEWINFGELESRNIDLNQKPNSFSTDGRERRLSETLRNALTHQSLQTLLRHGDRNSMRWSVESRVPFLTTEFAEYILQLPENYLLSDKGETKFVFREAMRGIVPDEILDRQDKIGFSTPENEIISGIKENLKESIEPLREMPFLDIKNLEKEVVAVMDYKKQSKLRLWNLFNLSRFISIAKENY